MNLEKTQSFVVVITDTDLPTFLEKKREAIKKYNADILLQRIGVSFIPMPSQQGMGLMGVPYLYLEICCTEETYKQWKFKNKLSL